MKAPFICSRVSIVVSTFTRYFYYSTSKDQFGWWVMSCEVALDVGTQLTDHSRLQVDKDGSGNVLPCSRLTEEGIEGVVSASNSLVTGHLAIRLDPMFQTVKLPAGIAHLGSGLADMHRNTLTLLKKKKGDLLKPFH